MDHVGRGQEEGEDTDADYATRPSVVRLRPLRPSLHSTKSLLPCGGAAAAVADADGALLKGGRDVTYTDRPNRRTFHSLSLSEPAMA